MQEKFSLQVFECDKPNRNKRIYPKHIIEQNVERLNNSIQNRSLLGELEPNPSSIIHFSKASHIVSKIHQEDNKFFVEIETLNTPSGKMLQSLIENKVKFFISPRGIGSATIDAEGNYVIGDDYKIITFDIVAD
jgi:hypothetical protein